MKWLKKLYLKWQLRKQNEKRYQEIQDLIQRLDKLEPTGVILPRKAKHFALPSDCEPPTDGKYRAGPDLWIVAIDKPVDWNEEMKQLLREESSDEYDGEV